MRILSMLAVSSLSLAAFGCTVTTSPDPVPGQPVDTQGSVEIDWTINRRTDPSACNQSVAASIIVDIFDSSGRALDSYEAPCGAFATTIPLYSGTYTANATLVDGAGQSRTTTVSIAPFSVRGGTVIQVPIDFPASSFF